MERRLEAILATDVMGYSNLMSEDEAGIFAALTLIALMADDARSPRQAYRSFDAIENLGTIPGQRPRLRRSCECQYFVLLQVSRQRACAPASPR